MQEYMEYKVGCSDIGNWSSYKHILQSYKFNYSDVCVLNFLCKEDALSYYMKALVTYVQALMGIKDNNTTWAIVRLYYSMFYLTRCRILLSNNIMVRCSSLHVAELGLGEGFSVFQSSKVKGDHQLTFKYAEKLQASGAISDLALTNKISDDSVYIWAMKHRERVNYQQRYFSDPVIDDIIKIPKDYIIHGELQKLFELYNKDSTHTFCFVEDYIMTSVAYFHLSSLFHYVYPTMLASLRIYVPQLKMCRNILKSLNIDDNFIKSFVGTFK